MPKYANRSLTRAIVLCGTLLSGILVAGSACAPPDLVTDSGTAYSGSLTIAAGSVTSTPQFRLTTGNLYSLRIEGSSGADSNANLFTASGTLVMQFEDVGTTEYREFTAATGNYYLMVYNNGDAAVTVSVSVTRT